MQKKNAYQIAAMTKAMLDYASHEQRSHYTQWYTILKCIQLL